VFVRAQVMMKPLPPLAVALSSYIMPIRGAMWHAGGYPYVDVTPMLGSSIGRRLLRIVGRAHRSPLVTTHVVVGVGHEFLWANSSPNSDNHAGARSHAQLLRTGCVGRGPTSRTEVLATKWCGLGVIFTLFPYATASEPPLGSNPPFPPYRVTQGARCSLAPATRWTTC